jgi:hypothetical protein
MSQGLRVLVLAAASTPQLPFGSRRLQQHARHKHAAGAFVTNQSRFVQSWLDAHHIVHGGSRPRARHVVLRP